MLVDESRVPADYFIAPDELERWRYFKGGEKEKRTTSEGFEYDYSEGPPTTPTARRAPSSQARAAKARRAPSKHVVVTQSGRYRRLLPLELERLNMFPDNHTAGASDIRRAFLMGNALVTGIVERIAITQLPLI